MELSFSTLGLPEPILAALGHLGHTVPTPIQAQSIPVLMSGRDLLGQAQTGTGKTGAYVLPLLSKLDLTSRAPQVLVLAPTRELAVQVADSFKSYAKGTKGFRVIPIYGGQPMFIQLRELDHGAQVIVGTPGRVMDHLNRKSLDLSKITTLVLDEADEMLKMGFKDDIEAILATTPAEKQVALFSATMSPEIRRVASRHLKNAQEVHIKSKTATVETIQQFYCSVPAARKTDALERLLEVRDIEAAIIFVRTKAATVTLADELEAHGHKVAALNGDLTQQLRERTVERLKQGKLKLVVATDVAARGLHVDNIDHIINYDIPRETESYVHRIGRTGRAGKTGTAILFVTPKEERLLRIIEKTTRQPITKLALPDGEAIISTRIRRFKERMTAELSREGNLAPYTRAVEELAKESGRPVSEIGGILCRLVQKDAPFEDMARLTKMNEPSPADEKISGKFSQKGDSSRYRREGETNSVRYRIAVGRADGVAVGSIVAVIAKSGGVDGRQIGNIKLHDAFSTVELPAEVSRSQLARLRHVKIGGKELLIALDQPGMRDEGGDFAPREHSPGRYRARDAQPHRPRSASAPHTRDGAPAADARGEKGPKFPPKAKKKFRKKDHKSK